MSRRLGLLPAAAALLLLLIAPSANAGEKLAIPAARERASSFAENTCAHDEACHNAGVQNCRRASDRVVLCRIFDHRKTEEQGSFLCTRLVRLALQPPSQKVRVTGVSDWTC
ncbi:MAG: hypothetical protein ACJ75T_01730 [Solirubrobacterales bacterium]